MNRKCSTCHLALITGLDYSSLTWRKWRSGADERGPGVHVYGAALSSSLLGETHRGLGGRALGEGSLQGDWRRLGGGLDGDLDSKLEIALQCSVLNQSWTDLQSQKCKDQCT